MTSCYSLFLRCPQQLLRGRGGMNISEKTKDVLIKRGEQGYIPGGWGGEGYILKERKKKDNVEAAESGVYLRGKKLCVYLGVCKDTIIS